ncbi:hypothetical protein [Polaromonas sp.]|uniref:hypothetical protein n=1 Tax=Polaromonas sp. TaxID=1869339 RepID=UPI003BACCD40
MNPVTAYGFMKNPAINDPLLPANASRTIFETLASPFERVTLKRSMRLFDASIGLKPGIAGLPSAEVLVHVITGHESHEALVRVLVGAEYQNFRNLVRKVGSQRGDTVKDLSKQTGLTEDNLVALAHGNKDGALVPDLLKLFEVGLGAPVWAFKVFTNHTLNCPSCGKNFFEDVDTSWKAKPLALGKPEYEFAERFLTAILGAILIAVTVMGKQISTTSLELLGSLVDEKQYPIGNWLKLVCKAYGVKTLTELELRLALRKVTDTNGKPISGRRLADWARGTNLISVDNSYCLLAPLGGNDELKMALLAARAFAFVEEFLVAADARPYAPDAALVRQVIKTRLEELNMKLVHGLKIFQTKMIAKSASALPESVA